MIAKLEMLIALAQERHFGRAAESLSITQPTLSAGLKQLEDHLGVKLVERGSRFGGLTPEGHRALVMARRIVGDTRRLRDEMRAKKDGLSGKLRLGVIPTALTWASRLAARLTERHPGIGFSIRSTSSQNALTMLENLELDACLTYLDNEPLGRVSTVRLYRETYRLVCHRAHPFAARGRVGWAEVAEQKLCLLTPEMQNRRIINRNMLEAGKTPEALIEANSTVVLAATVARGDWVTILPGDIADFLVAGKAMAAVPIDDAGHAHAVGLITEFQEPHTPVLTALMQEAARLAEAS
ncbi:transcriptional regulator, LysR family protein [Pseudooceanicola batsensis HTCC2597]|uniref:Transcriptional regulator, LysR family protein n=1 Tax=Pseudooceanicola batsensis (strain ATCC BAA-863 / DSM 15984 / KCTC 12145 / HTCC2597) TaxID=252305 RepID=A3TTJ2_PSEBH|nr:LysR family transcriptional regulator [Pseudooceanicola batsensis]EAQ04969.1 transcriptional regulator, LysR family protein [Pseudooceanicola batsensis HTCC2597]